MIWKRYTIRREETKKITKLLFFVMLSIIPFLSVTNLLGMETFLDSFENPDSYMFLKNSNGYLASNIKGSSFIIIKRSNHPEFDVKEWDTVLYSSSSGDISCNTIEHIYSIGPLKRYKLKGNDIKEYSETIYEEQIIGKVVKTLDNNIWNTFSLELWSITIDNLNICSLIK